MPELLAAATLPAPAAGLVGGMAIVRVGPPMLARGPSCASIGLAAVPTRLPWLPSPMPVRLSPSPTRLLVLLPASAPRMSPGVVVGLVPVKLPAARVLYRAIGTGNVSVIPPPASWVERFAVMVTLVSVTAGLPEAPAKIPPPNDAVFPAIVLFVIVIGPAIARAPPTVAEFPEKV